MPKRIMIAPDQGVDLDAVAGIQRTTALYDPTGAITTYDSLAIGQTITVSGNAGLALWEAWVSNAEDSWISSDPDVPPAPLPSEDGDGS